MTEVLPDDGSQNFCYNCLYFEWRQPEDKKSIKQCARCKFVMYCSWQCQREHWENVHKHQCKYIAKLKIKHNSVHDEATCRACKLEAEVGPEEMSRLDNPVLKCLNKFEKDRRLGSPFPLGEMTGQFLTKEEATVLLMLRILHKLHDTKHTVWIINPKNLEDMYNILVQATDYLWSVAYMLDNPGPRLDQAAVESVATFFSDFDKLIKNTDELLAAVKFKEVNELRPWETLKLLACFLFGSSSEQLKIATESVGLPEMSEDLLKIRVTSGQFSDLWQKILDTLHGMLVPYIALVEVMCGGQLRQKCYRCLKDVTVTNVRMKGRGSGEGNTGLFVQGPVLMFGYVLAVACISPECFQQCQTEIIQHDADLSILYSRRLHATSVSKCDYCRVWTAWNKGHRCSRCLTKVYCGQGCRDKDWAVHKLVCREGEVERKVKGGQQVRKEESKFVSKCGYCRVRIALHKGYRCTRCLTERYCRERCRDKDWVVHKLVCREGQEQRKEGSELS